MKRSRRPPPHVCVSAIDSKTYDRRWQNLLYAKLASGRDLQNIYGLQMSSTSGPSMNFGAGIAEYEASSETWASSPKRWKPSPAFPAWARTSLVSRC